MFDFKKIYNNQYLIIIPILCLILFFGSILRWYMISVDNKSKSEDKEKFSAENSILKTKPIIKIFNFNTEWCGWSKRFQPEWNSFMDYVKNPNNNLTHIQAFDVKCDNENNKNICEKYRVPGYPYVIIEVNDTRISYEGERTKDALISYVSAI